MCICFLFPVIFKVQLAKQVHSFWPYFACSEIICRKIKACCFLRTSYKMYEMCFIFWRICLLTELELNLRSKTSNYNFDYSRCCATVKGERKMRSGRLLKLIAFPPTAGNANFYFSTSEVYHKKHSIIDTNSSFKR